MTALRHANGPSTASSSLQFVTHHMSYAIKIDVGDRAYNVIFDTGSADLWLATEDIDCYCGEQQKIDKHMCCKFGASANGTFGQGRSDNGHIGLLYGDATAIYGPSGYDRVSVAGIEVDRQEYIMAEQAVWAHGGTYTSSASKERTLDELRADLNDSVHRRRDQRDHGILCFRTEPRRTSIRSGPRGGSD